MRYLLVLLLLISSTAQADEPSQLVETYLNTVIKQLPPPEQAASAMGKLGGLVKQTQSLWSYKLRKARRDHARSLSFLMLFYPKEIEVAEKSRDGDSAVVELKATTGNPNWNKLRGRVSGLQATFELNRLGDKWLLSGFTPASMMGAGR